MARRMHVSLRVTSMGNALMHEMKGAGDRMIRSPCSISMAIACF